jgi:glycosyltransferase involved in cell wall biosynthesis
MRLLFLNHNVAWRGGTFYRAYHVGHYLAQRGHSVTLLTISQNRRWGFEHEESDGVHIVHTPDLLSGSGRSGWDPWDTLNRSGYLRGKQWDIIHAWDCRPAVILPALYARRQCKKNGAKLVIDWCDWWGRGGTIQERSGWLVRTFFGPIETFFEEAFRNRADGNTVISKALYHRARGLKVSAETLHILPQGCDVESSSPKDRSQARHELGFPPDVPLIGYLGRLIRSDAALLFDTLRVLFRQRSDCRALMIGNHQARIPDDLGQTGQVVEMGFVCDEKLHNYLAACDVLLAPLGDTLASRARWPSKVNLFLSAGRATVISRVGDLAELLERKDGALITTCQPHDIANKVIRLLEDSALREHYEKRACWVAENILSWSILIEQLENFYRKIFAS